MRYKLDEKELKIINRVISITSGDYDLENDYIPVEKLISAIEDLICEIGRLEERYSDLEKELNENYEPIPYAKQIGYNERDFY